MTGGPEASSGPYPALSIEIDLAPVGRGSLGAHAGLANTEVLFETKELVKTMGSGIRPVRYSKWKLVRDRNRKSRLGCRFRPGPKNSLGMFVGPTEYLPEKSFVISRQPDQVIHLVAMAVITPISGMDNLFWKPIPDQPNFTQ